MFEEFGVGANHQIEKRIPRWRALREEIRESILTRGFNPRIGAFTQAYGSEALDASVLLIRTWAFCPPMIGACYPLSPRSSAT